MNTIERLKAIKEHFENISIEEFEQNLIKAGMGEDKPMDYMIKYNAVIIRLMYAMSPYFKNLEDIDEDEVINTACDSLAIYCSEHFK